MKKILPILLAIIFVVSCSTDNNGQANDPANQGNMTVIKVKPKSFIPEISFEVQENSGLILHNNLLWTFNDSGGESKLYGLNFSGEIEREILIENANNVDWEDIAQDEEFFYIGDFGNNNGQRKDLKIFQVKKSEIDSGNSAHATAISFSYVEQENFNYRPLNTPFDCEAITDFKGTLNIFTKNWVDEKTSVYQVPKAEGEYTLGRLEEFNVNGLVTGADISPDEKKLAMIGYKDFKPVVWLFPGIGEDSFFKTEGTYMELDEIFPAQTEGICFMGNDTLLISCERTQDYIQQIFFIDLKNLDK